MLGGTLAACEAVPGSSTTTPTSQPSAPLGSIAPGEAVHLGRLGPGGRLDAKALVIDEPSASLAYSFNVDEGIELIRAGVDQSERDTCVGLRLIDPTGRAAPAGAADWPGYCPDDGRRNHVFNLEASARGPEVGRWRVEVVAEGVTNLDLRLRVLAEAAAGHPAPEPGLLLPNLVPWLPWEFDFVAPGSPNPGTANDLDNLPGDPTVSCHKEEEPGATHCLRFSAGVHNVGDGPLYVAFQGDDAIQHVYTPDDTPGDYRDNEAAGRFETSSAGHGEFHDFHQHRHVGDFVLYELLRLTDEAAGTLEPIGAGDKHGYCTFSQQLSEWDGPAALEADHQFASYVGDGFCRDHMTLERGWGDVYRWQRPGQYVSFAPIAEADGSMPPGRYVLRLTVDPDGHVRETDETDNVGYALIRIVDADPPSPGRVILCRLGSGQSPWYPGSVAVNGRFDWNSAGLGRTHPTDCPA